MQVIENHESDFYKDADVIKDLIHWRRGPSPSLRTQPIEDY